MNGFVFFQAILILLIAAAVVALTVPWAIENVGISMDLTELNLIKSQFDDCNERIIETARTGSTNECIFNIKKGEITGAEEGIYYTLASNAPICDASPLVELDPRNHIWQNCSVSGKQRVYGLLWKFPATLNITGDDMKGNQMSGQTNFNNITFTDQPINFSTLTLYVNFQYQTGQKGNVVELSRVSVTDTNITLKVDIS